MYGSNIQKSIMSSNYKDSLPKGWRQGITYVHTILVYHQNNCSLDDQWQPIENGKTVENCKKQWNSREKFKQREASLTLLGIRSDPKWELAEYTWFNARTFPQRQGLLQHSIPGFQWSARGKASPPKSPTSFPQHKGFLGELSFKYQPGPVLLSFRCNRTAAWDISTCLNPQMFLV